MKPPPPEEFAAVPYDECGQPIDVAYEGYSYDCYIDWLADYLYRPKPGEEPLSESEASPLVCEIEGEVFDWMVDHMFAPYPPDEPPYNGLPGHADILHRVELSAILSRVHNHLERRRLVDWFYSELDYYLSK